LTLNRAEEDRQAGFCYFGPEVILFPKGYYFNHGYLKNKNELSYASIDEIRINTHPVSAKINGNEIVFLCGAEREDCEKMATAQNIPTTEPTDNWSLICDEFLDVELNQDYVERIMAELIKAGISEEETKAIRKTIRWRMEAKTYFSWEWIYYGQFDVLEVLYPLRENKYWWTMEIALRDSEN